LLLGGPASYALADWQRGPLESVSPVKCKPDLRVAVVLGLDASGSMGPEFDRAVRALLDVGRRFDADDDVAAMAFSDTARILEPDALRKVTPTGGTRIARGIDEAARHLRTRPAGRKFIILMTDGESAAEETPDMVKASIAGLQDIGLVVITTHREVPGAVNVPIDGWKDLEAKLREVTDGLQDLVRREPAPLDLKAHPVTDGVAPVVLANLNRTTAKPDAQVLATVGRAPAQDPVLALRPFGHGRVAAFTAAYTPAIARLVGRALDYVVGERASGLTLSAEPPVVIAQGTYPDAEFTTDGVRVEMKQVGPRRWEGRLPAGLTGTAVVRKGRARAAVTIPCPAEFAALGVDRAALERIARETGGRVLQSADLGALPRPERTAARSGRPLFLVAALALVFLELAVSTYWKE
ncbi:MAG TPA: VWA domain-containing protein, partial [Acidimicrobiales bacterium]|nr:VWA domain-containing protein [Acidimicrobiales bacterium]